MCGGPDQNRERRKAEKKQRQADKEAARRQEELDRISAQRTAIVNDQTNALAQMKTDADAILAGNQATVKNLEREQAIRIQGIRDQADSDVARISDDAGSRASAIRDAADREAAEIADKAAKTVAATKLAGGAASASLRALGEKQPKANNAKQTRRGARAGGSRGTTQAQVQRGSGSRGRGPNLSI